MEVELVAREVRLEEGDHLLELVDPARRGLERDAHHPVLLLAPPRADAELEPAVGEEVERRDLLRQRRRLVVIHAEDAAPDAQRVGDRGGGGHRRDRPEVLGRGPRSR